MIPYFRYFGDFLHLISFIILIKEIISKRKVNELSYKTQEIYLFVFLFRYSNIFIYFISYYNLIFKILFIYWTIYIIYLIRFKKPYCLSYEKYLDTFNHYLYIYPISILLTILFHYESINFKYYEYFLTWSIWLESFAMIPQINIIYKKKEVEWITSNYITTLGWYKLFYIFHWILIYINTKELKIIKIIAATIQTFICIDFLYYYYKSIKINSKIIKI